MPADVSKVIAALQLEPCMPEGGFFRQTWRSAAGSAIWFMMTPTDFSALHRLTQPEIWHFYAGDPVEHLQLDPRDGRVRVTRMGPAVLAGEQPQVIVPAGVWQGARVSAPGPTEAAAGYALLGCTLAPPWDERSFELGRRAELLREFPAEAARICALTR